MIRTQVGYAGGDMKNPTYHNLGNHSEAIQIEYDPKQMTYEELLEIFWDSHYPVMPAFSRQYASLIFYHNEEQGDLAEKSKKEQEDRIGRKLYTELVPYSEFYPAEDYHQKHRLQNHALMKEYKRIYPDFQELVASTAVARVNGYLAGNGSDKQFEKDLGRLGLSDDGRKKLRKAFSVR